METSLANSQQVPTVLKNTLRFLWNSDEEFVERRVFGRDVLFGALNLKSDDLLCLQKNGKEKFYDVTFYTITKMDEVKGLAARLADGPLKCFKVQSLCRTGERIVTVHIYNPWVTEEATRYFLARYTTVLAGMGEIRDSLGIWTGKRQFRVMLKDDPNGYDGFRHPPATFTIGTNRGFLIYAGQPKYCRRCATYGHVATSCSQVRCRNCDGLGHTMRDCKLPKKCSLCGSERHLFKHCSEILSSYASVARKGAAVTDARCGEKPVADDPRASSLRAIEDVIAELTRGREIEEVEAAAPDEASLPAQSGDSLEEQREELEWSEEISSDADWIVAENRSAWRKRKRAKANVSPSPPSSPPPLERNRFNVLCSEFPEEIQEENEDETVAESNDEMVTPGETTSTVAAIVGEEEQSGKTGEPSTQKDIPTSDSSRLPPSGVPGESSIVVVSSLDDHPVPQSSPLPPEDGSPVSEHSED